MLSCSTGATDHVKVWRRHCLKVFPAYVLFLKSIRSGVSGGVGRDAGLFPLPGRVQFLSRRWILFVGTASKGARESVGIRPEFERFSIPIIAYQFLRANGKEKLSTAITHAQHLQTLRQEKPQADLYRGPCARRKCFAGCEEEDATIPVLMTRRKPLEGQSWRGGAGQAEPQRWRSGPGRQRRGGIAGEAETGRGRYEKPVTRRWRREGGDEKAETRWPRQEGRA